MKVDVRFPDLDLFLQRWRARLNRRWLGGEALAAWVTVGASALPLAWFVPHGALWWAGVTAASALGYALAKFPRRLTTERAAAWLDESCGTRGVFGAAVVSLDNEGGFGTAVLEAADKSRAAAKPRLPWRRFALRGALAAVVGATALLSFEAPTLLAGRATAESEAPASAPAPTTPPSGTPRELKPGEAARKLFPENPRLAALAEQALTDGGEDALLALLEEAQDAQRLPGTGQNRNRPRQNGPNTDRPGEARPDAPGDSRGNQSPKTGGQASPPPGEQTKPDEGPSSPGQDKDRGDSSGSTQGQADSGSGHDQGKGHSTTPLGQVTPAPGAAPLVLKEPSTAGLFEFALPGSGPRLPTADTLAAARRSAESQVARSRLPLEFQSTVRDYFLSLHQEALP